MKDTGQSIAADPLSKRSATNGWRVAYKKFLAENASQIAGKGTSQALQVASKLLLGGI